MNSQYFRLPQDASDLLDSGNEKAGNNHRHQSPSWRRLILSLSVVVNVLLFVPVFLMLKEKPTPTEFGKNKTATRVGVATDTSQPKSILSRPHGTSSGGTRLTVPKTTQIVTSCGKLFYRLMVSWRWIANGQSRDSGRLRCTYRAITAKVSTFWKPIISCTVWYVSTHPALPHPGSAKSLLADPTQDLLGSRGGSTVHLSSIQSYGALL